MPFGARPCAAFPAEGAVEINKIDQRGPGPELMQAKVRERTFDGAAEDVTVEGDHAFKVGHPEDQVIEVSDVEGGRAQGHGDSGGL